MNTTTLLGLFCCIFLVEARMIAEDPHEVNSPNKMSFDVNKFINETPELIPSGEEMMMGTKCECAVFDTQFPTENSTAILIHSPFNVSCNCNSTVDENCRKVCAAFAESARDHGPQLLCSTLGHYNNLLVSVHSRLCGTKQWTYTGITAPHEICCHEHEVVPCETQEENPVQNQI